MSDINTGNTKLFKTDAIRFARWLLKNATIEFDGQYLCWLYEGEFYDTAELYEVFVKLC